MKDKKKSKIIAAISMISVFVMIVWGTIAGTYQHAWLAVFAGVIAMTIVSMFYKGESSNTKNNDNTDTDSN